MVARFRIDARVDGVRGATVSIDRALGLFVVRPLRRRREYVAPLAAVAEMVVSRIVKAEIAQRLAEKRRTGISRRRLA